MKQKVDSDTIIGANTKYLRQKKYKWSQAKLARYLRIWTDTPWDQAQVSLAEHGRRSFKVVDLMILGWLFKVPPIRLLHLNPNDLDDLDLPELAHIKPGDTLNIRFGKFGAAEPAAIIPWLLGWTENRRDLLTDTWSDPAETDDLEKLTDLIEEAYERAAGDIDGKH